MNLIDDLAELFELVDENGNAITEFYATVTLDDSGIICKKVIDLSGNKRIKRKRNGKNYNLDIAKKEKIWFFDGYFYPFISGDGMFRSRTNGDLIRAMNDEELSEFLKQFTEWLISPICGEVKIERSNPKYKGQLLEWVKRKA